MPPSGGSRAGGAWGVFELAEVEDVVDDEAEGC